MDAQPPADTPTGMPPERVGDASGVVVGSGGVPAARTGGGVEVFAPAVPVGLPLAGPRRTLWRLVLAAFIAMIPVLCTGGIAVAFHIYDRATTPDRSTPAAAADEYLHKFLVNRDSAGAALYRCADASGLTDFETYWLNQESYAASLGAVAKLTYSVEGTSISENTAIVSVTVVEDTTGPSIAPGNSRHPWKLYAQKGPDWRICSATPG